MPFHPSTSPSTSRPGVRLLVLALSGLLLLALLGVALALQGKVPGAATAARLDDDGLFDLTNVWNLHLTFTPDQWKGIEPQGGSGPFGGGGPGGPGGSGGPGGFGPGMFIAPAFLKLADTNQDTKISRAEFSALAQRWFAAWDTNRSGTLDAAKIRLGLDAALQSAGGPRPGGPGGGPGGPSPFSALRNHNNFPTVRADLDFEGWRFPDVSVRYKGNNTYMTSRGQLKRPLKIELNHGFKGRRLGGVTTLNLHNNINDAGSMNEPLSYWLFRDAGVPGSRTAYARVYLSVPGQYTNHYVGLYSIIENVDNNFARSRFGTKRGAIFKPVTRQVFEDLGDKWSDYQQTYGARTPVFDHETKRIIAFSKLVSHASDTEFAARLEEFLDLDEFARFMAVTVWLSNMDSILSMGQNFYVYLHPKTLQFQFLPWDFDHSFGQFPMAGSAADLENLSLLHPWNGQVLFLERVFKTARFQQLYSAHLKDFSQTIFRPERIQRQVDKLAQVLRPAVQAESDQLLARFDAVVAGKDVSPGGFGGPGPGGMRSAPASSSLLSGQANTPRSQGSSERRMGGFGGGGPPGGFGQAMKPIKTFVVARAASVNDQLAGKAEGAVLSRSGPGGPPGGRGGGGPPGRGGPGGPGGFGPGMFLAQAFISALDADEDGILTQAEFTQGLLKLFDSWNTDKTGLLTEEQLRAGINQDLSPFRGGPPPGMGFGPPPDDSDPSDGPDDF